jgi:hypothetical protein
MKMLTILAIVAIVAAVGMVGTVTAMSSIQVAHADVGGGQSLKVCGKVEHNANPPSKCAPI